MFSAITGPSEVAMQAIKGRALRLGGRAPRLGQARGPGTAAT